MGSNNSGSVERAYLIRGPGLEDKKRKERKKASRQLKNLASVMEGDGCGNLAAELVTSSTGKNKVNHGEGLWIGKAWA